MTTINSVDDFLRALDANPSWREAVRARILGEELLKLPVKFETFSKHQEAFNEGQSVWNRNTETRLSRIEGDLGGLKGEYARTRMLQDATGIASEMGLDYVHALSREDLRQMAGGALDRDTLRNFRNADLVIETTDGTDTQYIAMEISYTADKRELLRAIRNAGLITRFTGKRAQAAVASVRNDSEAQEAVESGGGYWHPLEDRTPVQE